MTTPTALETSSGVIVSKNPLEVIGWSHSILDLKLTQDGYYQLAVKCAQILAAQKHEDKGQPSAISQHFTAAYAAVKDREQFNQAMREFREERNITKRSESDVVTRLSREVQILKSQTELLRKPQEYRGYGVEALSKINTNLMKYVAARGMEVYNHSLSGVDVTAASLFMVKSLTLLTIRFSGAEKSPGKLRKGEYCMTARQLLGLSRVGIRHELLQHFDIYCRGAFMKFIERFVDPTFYVIFAPEKVSVRSGYITKRIHEIDGCKIIGSIDGGELRQSQLKVNRKAMVQLSKIAVGINPYMVYSNFLVVDKKPRLIKRADLTPYTERVSIDASLDKKLDSYEYSSKRAHSSSDLVVLGLIMGINEKKVRK